jgi:hypothetical protein
MQNARKNQKQRDLLFDLSSPRFKPIFSSSRTFTLPFAYFLGFYFSFGAGSYFAILR